MLCGCKLGSVKRKKLKSRKFEITAEDILYSILGVGAGMLVNPLANKAVAGQSEQVVNAVGTALPVLKVAGGGYLAMQNTVDRRARFFGFGVGMEGSAELVLRYAPEEYVSIEKINGMDGDLFSYVGNSQVIEVPVTPSAALPAAEDTGFVNEAILGTEDLYEGVGAMQEMI